ncbi:MAG: hypothetical protein HY703_09545 [Gemmatimonadetes bacterium]|nr:hypothetical protein [Gemmatimonadota bacterium]
MARQGKGQHGSCPLHSLQAARSWGSVAWLALLSLLPAAPARAQFTSTVTEINPTQSDLDKAGNPSGATGGRVNGLARANDGLTFYAASEWGGLWQSATAGKTWFHLHDHLPTATWDVEVDPTNPNRAYATSFYDGRVNSLAGINVSTDGGATWNKPLTATPPSGFCLDEARRTEPSAFGIAIDPEKPQHVYVGTNCGLALSADAGATWTFVDPTPEDGADNVWDVAVHHGGIVDLCGDDGHQRSQDGGANWITLPAWQKMLPSGRCSIGASPYEPNALFAAVGIQVFQSADGGASWTWSGHPLAPQGRIPFLAVNPRSGSKYDLWYGDRYLYRAACSSPPDSAAAFWGLACKLDWAGPWPGAHSDAGDLAFDSKTMVDACPVLYSADGGVYYNTKVVTPGCHDPAWEQPEVTPRALWLWSLDGADHLGPAEDLYLGTQDNGSFAATDAGAAMPAWHNRDSGDVFDVSAAPDEVVYTLCCLPGAHITQVLARGQGMVGGGEIGPNAYPPGDVPPFLFIDNIDRPGGSYVMVTDSGVFYTSKLSTSGGWYRVGWATTPLNLRGVKGAALGGKLYLYGLVGEANGRTPDQLWKFTGAGNGPKGTWAQVSPPDAVGGFGIFDVDPNDANRLIASHLRSDAPPQMLMSIDGGANWASLSTLDSLMTGGGLFQYQNQRGATPFTGFEGYPQPTLVAFDPGDPDIVVAGAADAGVFVSIDGGKNWKLVTDPFDPVDSGRPHIPRPRFAYFDHQELTAVPQLSERVDIYVGSQGRGVWRITLEIPKLLAERCIGAHCWPASLDRGTLTLDCFVWPCVVTDKVIDNCKVKFPCPPEPAGAAWPPFYHMFLDGLDLGVWEVGFYTGRGQPAPFELFRTATGVVLSFQPSRELFRPGEIGDYLLAFAPRSGAKAGRTVIRTRLQVGDGHYTPAAGPLLEARPDHPGADMPSIGVATMAEDGTIVLELRAEAPGGVSGHGRLVYPPTHKDYQQILKHLGGLRPGESKPVPPWPDQR